MTPAPAGPALAAVGPDRRDAAVIGAIVAAWLGAMAAAMPWGDFPINDDWVYGLAVQALLEQGRYQFLSQPSSANVGPMVGWGALFCLPFGFSYDALRVSTMVLGGVAMTALYLLVRRCGGSRAGAALAASGLGFHPLFFALSASFMTDVPFVALTLVACCLLVHALQTGSRRTLVAGLAVALCVVLIRQLGIALLVGWAVAWMHARGPSLRTAAGGVLAVGAGLATHVGYQYWLVRTGRTLEIGHHSDPVALLREVDALAAVLRYTAGLMVANLGFLAIPVALWFAGRSADAARSARRATGIAFVVVLASLTVFGQLPVPNHNVLASWTSGPLLLRDIEILKINAPPLPDPVRALWVLVNAAAVLAATVLLARIAPAVATLVRRRSWRAAMPDRARASVIVLLLVPALAYSALMLFASLRFAMFDRYWLYVAPLLAAALFAIAGPEGAGLASRVQRWTRASAWGAVVVLAGMSIAMTHDFMAASRARWQLLDQTTGRDGIDPRRIDGGYEFNGPRLYARGYVASPARSWWWVEGDEYLVAAGPVPGYVEMDRRSFDRWFIGGRGQIVLLRRTPVADPSSGEPPPAPRAPSSRPAALPS